jgi:hypothetical protein
MGIFLLFVALNISGIARDIPGYRLVFGPMSRFCAELHRELPGFAKPARACGSNRFLRNPDSPDLRTTWLQISQSS